MLPAGANPATTRRAFTGVYEFDDLQPDTPHEITVTANGETQKLETRTLPDAIPDDLDRWFNVLLVSCFHQAEDRGGLASTIVSQMSAMTKPHLTFLAGDQVYLDLPTLQNFPDDMRWLADKFERDYVLNWAGPLAYTGVLKAAPSVSVPDDHEYWNNFPHASTIVQNSWSEGSREHWRLAAAAMFEGFQLPYPAKVGEAIEIDVKPLAFFLADTRTDKDPDRKFTMSLAERQQLDRWVTRVIDEKKFGVFLSGQSLFRTPARPLAGVESDYAVGDYELPDYGDFPEIVTSLRRLADAGRPVLCLTGDVHWGRVVTAQNVATSRMSFAEVISSPASLVSTVGVDQAKKIINVIGGLFGKKNDWPRHSSPEKPPDFLASNVLGKAFHCEQVGKLPSGDYPQRGNHVAMLSFRQHAGGVELLIKYWPISPDARIGRPVEMKAIDLTNA